MADTKINHLPKLMTETEKYKVRFFLFAFLFIFLIFRMLNGERTCLKKKKVSYNFKDAITENHSNFFLYFPR